MMGGQVCSRQGNSYPGTFAGVLYPPISETVALQAHCWTSTLRVCLHVCAHTLPLLDHAPIRQQTPTRSPDTHEEP